MSFQPAPKPVSGRAIRRDLGDVEFWANQELTPLLRQLRAYANKGEALNVLLTGATGLGVHDDTKAIETALGLADAVYLPAGTYLTDGIRVPSGKRIFGDGAGSIVRLATGAAALSKSHVFLSANEDLPVVDVTIENLAIDGNATGQAFNTTGDSRGSGIGIRGAQDCTFRRLTIYDTAADGIALSETTTVVALEPAARVRITDVTVTNFGRNGVSITHGEDIVIDKLVALDSSNPVPGDGVDLEPNSVSTWCRNVRVSDSTFRNLSGCGVRCFGDSALNVYNVVVSNCHADACGVNARGAIDGHEAAGFLAYYSQDCTFSKCTAINCGAVSTGPLGVDPPTAIGDGFLIFGFGRFHRIADCRSGHNGANLGYNFRELTDGVNSPDFNTFVGCSSDDNASPTQNTITLIANNNSRRRDCNDQRGRNISNVALKGAWTPELKGSLTDGAVTNLAYDCTYTRSLDENLVWVRGRISWDAHTWTGTVQIHGLPYASNATANREHALTIIPSGVTYAGSLGLVLSEGRSFMQPVEQVTGGARTSLACLTNLGAMSITFSGCYEPADL